MTEITKTIGQLTILKSQDDWDKWIEQLSAQVDQDVWQEYVDPDSDQQGKIPKKPARPQEEEYSSAYITARRAAQDQGLPEPDFDRNKYACSEEERKEWREDLDTYTRTDMPSYTYTMRMYTEAARLINLTCDDAAKIHVKAREPIRTQVQKLQQIYKGSEARRKRRATEMYQAAIQKPTKQTPEALATWLAQWQNAMVYGEAVELAYVTDYFHWTKDLSIAIGSTIPSTMSQILETQEGDGKLTSYRDVAKRIQSEWSMQHGVRPAQMGARRGAFAMAPTVPDSERSGQSDEQAGSNEDYTVDRRDRDKRTRTGTVGGCWGCNMKGHGLKDCYFAVPERRHQGWKPIEFRKQIWLRNKKTNKVIKEMKKLKLAMPADDECKALKVLNDEADR
jgi:predicted nucleic acid-binding Zn ribbon protein